MALPIPQTGLKSLERCLRGRKRTVRQYVAQPRRTAAVYVLFSGTEDDPVMTLIRRSGTVSQHRGEYAFPGGGVEASDGTVHDTALREVNEELGVSIDAIEPWGELESEMTVTSGYLVVPFTGRLDGSSEFNPAPAEVAEIVHVPFGALLDPTNERSITMLTSPTDAAGDLEFKTYEAYAYEGRVIWGATARIIGQVVSLVRSA